MFTKNLLKLIKTYWKLIGNLLKLIGNLLSKFQYINVPPSGICLSPPLDTAGVTPFPLSPWGPMTFPLPWQHGYGTWDFWNKNWGRSLGHQINNQWKIVNINEPFNLMIHDVSSDLLYVQCFSDYMINVSATYIINVSMSII